MLPFPDELRPILLACIGGRTEDAMNKEFKKLLAVAGINNGATLYTLRNSHILS